MPISRSAFLLAALSITGCVAHAGFHAGGAATTAGDPGGPAAIAGGRPARGEPGTQLDDFSFEVKESTGYYNQAWVINKLTTFKVAPACWRKMIDHENDAVHTATFYTSDVAEYAKLLTGDDWSSIETQNNNDREHNKHLVEPMIEAFSSRFGLTIIVEGDDCNVSNGALWLKYWTQIGTTLKSYPPASGKLFITLDVTPSVKDVSVTVDPSGSELVITAPRDIESVAWDDKMSKPFRKLARSL